MPPPPGTTPPDRHVTVVPVHGAFADASRWNGVVSALLRHGLAVVAPPNPLRGVTADSAYIASVLGQIDGPVLLVTHSYGGAVITKDSVLDGAPVQRRYPGPEGQPATEFGIDPAQFHTDLVRSMAQRAGAEIVELAGSHVIMVSRPDAVTEVIVRALEAATEAAELPSPREQADQIQRATGPTS